MTIAMKIDTDPKGVRPQSHPCERAGLFARLCLWWFWPLLRLGYKQPLKDEDVWELPRDMWPSEVQPVFFENLNACNGKILHALIRIYFWRWFPVLILDLTLAGVFVLIPLMAWRVVEAISDDEPLENKVFAVVALFFCTIPGGSCVSSCYRIINWLGVELVAVLRHTIFVKTLSLTPSERLSLSSAEIGSIISVDTERIWHALHFGHWVITQFGCVAGTMTLLFVKVGWFAGGGLGTMIFLIFVQTRIVKASGKRRRQMQLSADQRTKLLSQVLDGIKGVKLNALEKHLQARIMEHRRLEEQAGRWVVFARALNVSTAYIIPLLSSMVIFILMKLFDGELSTPTVIGVLATCNVIRPPLAAMPLSVSYMVESCVSLSRIQQFIGVGSLPAASSDLAMVAESPGSISVDAKFEWPDSNVKTRRSRGLVDEPDSKLLAGTMFGHLHVDLQIKPGEFVAIVGSVGSGKSSLCEALLGMMPMKEGSIIISGEKSYAPQAPWILSGTVKENISLSIGSDGRPLNDHRYASVLSDAQLHPDLKQFPAGDETEIGGRGINLSGGQRARVGVARALYQNHAVIILDDVLSAVDVSVAEHIIETLRADNHATRLVCLNSHYEVLDHVDLIVAMDAGTMQCYRSRAEFETCSPVASRIIATADTNASKQMILSTDAPPWIAERFGGAQRQPLVSAANKEHQEGAGKLYLPEERTYGLLRKSTYDQYFGEGRGIVFMVLAISMMMCAEGFRVGTDICLARWAENLNDEWFFASIGMCGATIVFAYVRNLLFMHFVHMASGRLHANGLQKVLGASVPLFFDVTPTGRILNRFTKDQDVMDTLLPHYLLETVQDVCFVISLCIFCSVTTPLVLIIILPSAYLFVKIRSIYTRSSRELQRMEGISRSPIFAFCHEAFEGLTIVRSHRLSSMFFDRFEKMLMAHAKHFLHLNTCTPWVVFLIDILSASIFFFTAVSAVLLSDMIDKGILGLSVIYAMQLVGKMQFTIRITAEAENYLTSAERMGQFNSIPQECSPAELEVLPEPSWPTVGMVEFKAVNLRYRPHLPLVVKDLSFTIFPGERVGLVGRTGAGKSSVVLALFRILEIESNGAKNPAEILIDGVNISHLPLATLRSRLSIIPQDSLVWQGSVRENIDPTHMYSDADIWSVLRQLDMDGVVKRWPQQLQAAIKNENVSAGQKQLLTICRALLKKSPVVVLDEATANLDENCDQQAQNALMACLDGATTFTVAHRLQTLADYDRVLILSSVASGIAVEEVKNPNRCVASI